MFFSCIIPSHIPEASQASSNTSPSFSLALVSIAQSTVHASNRHRVVDPAGSLTPRPLGRPADRHDEFGLRGTYSACTLTQEGQRNLQIEKREYYLRQPKQSLPRQLPNLSLLEPMQERSLHAFLLTKDSIVSSSFAVVLAWPLFWPVRMQRPSSSRGMRKLTLALLHTSGATRSSVSRSIPWIPWASHCSNLNTTSWP